MECSEVREFLEAHALGALEPSEHVSVELHLRECPDCRLLADEYATVVTSLPQALAAVSPLHVPSSARDRLLKAVELAHAAPAPASERLVPHDEKRAKAWRFGSGWQWPTRWQPRSLGMVFGAVFLVISLVWGALASVALARERALRAEFADLVSQQQEIVLEVIDSNRTVKASLRAPESGSTAYGKLYTRPDLPYVVVMAARLSPPSEGHAYHLWLRSQGQLQLAGVLAVNSQGFGLLVFQADRVGPVYEAAHLTLQPEGSTALSDAPVLLWEAPR